MYRSSGRDALEALDEFQARGLIGELLGVVRIGKEASVYACRGGDGVIAAKVYRRRQFRFKNDAVYQQARSRELGIGGRQLRAFEKKSRFGMEMRSGSWVSREYETLRLLHAAGADVPRPIAASGEAVLMEYFGEHPRPAPQLVELRLEEEEARVLLQRVLNNVELFLACDRVHGDLSPYNVLYWEGDIRVIDLPQAVDPRFNQDAYDLLRRDLENVCRYFERFGAVADARAIARDLWTRFLRSEL